MTSETDYYFKYGHGHSHSSLASFMGYWFPGSSSAHNRSNYKARALTARPE